MFDSPLSASAYEILRVDPTAEDDDLRRAYRLRLRQTHPDTGGDAAVFIQVQRAWELVGTPEARVAYDRGHGFGATAAPDFSAWQPTAPPRDTRPRARSYGHPGGACRESYLTLMREWVGRGVELRDPYDPSLVRRAPAELRHLLADALAEEESARTISDLGMGYTVWHDVAAGPAPRHKIDHIVLGPSGLYAILSGDAGGPVHVRRGELRGDGVVGTPIADLVAHARLIARAARVKFSGAIIVLPDDDLDQPIDELGKVKGLPIAVIGRSTLSTVLRRGMTGVRDIGGNEIFDARTRLQRVVEFV